MGEEDTLLLVWRGGMKGETESEIMASQDQALQTKYRATNISQTDRQQMQIL